MAEFVLLDGTDDYISAPDHASFDITSDIDIRACLRLNDWSLGTGQSVVAKWLGSNSYRIAIRSAGGLFFEWKEAGGTTRSLQTDSVVPFANDADGWVRVTLDVNNGSSQHEVKFYTSTDSPDTDPASVAWTQLGTTVFGSGVTNIGAGTAPLVLGRHDDTFPDLLTGRFYYAEVRNGIDGTIVANPDFRDDDQADTDTQFTDSEGRVWTLQNGADWSGTIGAGSGEDYVDMDGSSGQGVSTPDHASLDITGNLQLIVGVSFEAAPLDRATRDNLITKGDGSAQYSFVLDKVPFSQDLLFGWKESGGTFRSVLSVGIVPATAGVFRWYKTEFVVATATVQFYYSDDPVTTAPGSVAWTLHNTATLSLATSIFSGTAAVWLGNRSDNPAERFVGRFFYAEVRNGVGGTIVASPDFRDKSLGDSPTQYTDAQTRVWTLAGAATWTEGGGGGGATDLTVTWRPFDVEFYPHRDSMSVEFIIELPPLDFVVDGVRWTATASTSAVDATWRPFDLVVDADRWDVTTEQEAEPPPPPPPLPVLTTEDLLSATSLSIAVGLELLDINDVVLADISSDLETGVVARNMNAAIHGTARFKLARTIEWHNQRLRPYMTISDLLSGVSERFDLGIYLPETPSRTTGRTPMTFDVEAYDKLVILDHPHGVAFTATAGDDVLTVIETILDGLDLPHAFDQSSSAVIPSTRSWPLSSQNTTLTIINDLLASVGYRGLYVDRQGVFRSEPYRPPAERAPVWHYDATSTKAIIGAEISEEIDLFAVPNWWVFVRDDPAQDAPSEGDGIYTVLNSTDGPTSISARGRVIRKVEYVDAADQASLVALGDQIVQRDRQPFAHLEFVAVPNPLHWHADSVTVTSSDLGLVGATFGEQSWSLPLDGGDMAHKVRRSVSV